MSGSVLGLAFLLAAQATASSPETRPAPSRPGLSWEEADSVTRVLRRIDRRLRSGRPASGDTIVVTEGQLNSFVNLTLADKIPPEMSDLELRLLPDRLAARARLDLDQLRSKIPEGGAATLLSMLTGVVPVELTGRVDSAEGLFRLELEEVLIGGVSLPPALLAQIVSFATRNEERPQGLDITAPVALPWTARQVRMRPGRALVDFYN
jgi:hypothetical protein